MLLVPSQLQLRLRSTAQDLFCDFWHQTTWQQVASASVSCTSSKAFSLVSSIKDCLVWFFFAQTMGLRIDSVVIVRSVMPSKANL